MTIFHKKSYQNYNYLDIRIKFKIFYPNFIRRISIIRKFIRISIPWYPSSSFIILFSPNFSFLFFETSLRIKHNLIYTYIHLLPQHSINSIPIESNHHHCYIFLSIPLLIRISIVSNDYIIYFHLNI